MGTTIAYFGPEDKDKPKNPFTIMDQMMIDNQYHMLRAVWDSYELWFNLELKGRDFSLDFFIRHCQAEPEYESFIADLRNEKGKIKSLLWPRNRKLAIKKYDEFIRFKEKEYMNAIKETSARVEEIIGDRKVFYDDLKEFANSITIKAKEKATDDE
ncbi:MAG: hypothetical protein J6D26_00515 [Clostridia bacterium]|nr:hypothetical protein [Clostridia bacterium]